MKKQIFYIIALSMLLCNCGSGMIGLLEPNKPDMEDSKYMDRAYIFQNGCEYFVYVENYIEPKFDCESTNLVDVVYSKLIVIKKCAEWEEGVELSDPYMNIVSDSLHSHYINYICGE